MGAEPSPRDSALGLAEPSTPTLAAEWRRLAIRLYASIDLALDSDRREASAILLEAATTADALIDELDALAMAAEGRAA